MQMVSSLSSMLGNLGRNSDGAIFRHSSFGELLEQGRLNVPPPTTLPGETIDKLFRYYFVGNEAFPLLPYLMWPYPKRVLYDAKRLCNFHLSRGRKSVEYTFSMLTSKFRVFERPITCNEDCAVAIVKAV
jgi:hypothetical protein